MRAFTVAPACQTLLDKLDAFPRVGPGVLPNPDPEPPAGLDVENAALYRHLVAIIGVIRGTLAGWQERALAEGRSAAQAVQSQSAP